jgi:DNA-directed RNA polymerase alpha subunit
MKKMPVEIREALDSISGKALIALEQGINDPIADLELLEFPQRYVNLLEDKGISLIGELLNYKWHELIGFKQFGVKALLKLYQCFAVYDTLKDKVAETQREVVIGSR